MKVQWARFLAFVNGMSLRERLLLFLAVVALLGALTDALFISPLIKLQAQQARELDKRTAVTESQKNRLDLQLAESRRKRVEELSARIAKTHGQVEAVDRQIAALSASAADIAAQRAILTRVLGRTDRVALLRLSSGEGAAASGVSPHGPGNSLDITLGGAYLDLMEYLTSIETAMPQARWSALRFTAETTPPQVAVRIVTPRGGS